MPRHGRNGTTGRRPLLFGFLGSLAIATTVGVPAAGRGRRLAVLVPVLNGDTEKAVSAISKWPRSKCSPQRSVDLLLYYETAAGEEQHVSSHAVDDSLVQGFGSCVGKFSIVHADLEEKESDDPVKAENVMFYKLFLGNNDVRPQLAVYDVLAVVKWEHVVAATDRFFEELLLDTEQEPEQVPFWVKVIGSTRGVAIYNNRDSDFVKYLSQTHARWGLREPYGEVMSRAVPDSLRDKFVEADVAGVAPVLNDSRGNEDITSSTSADLPASSPTVILGGDHLLSCGSGGGQKERHAGKGNVTTRKLGRTDERTGDEHEILEEEGRGVALRDSRCFENCTHTHRDGTKGRVCDPSCKTGDPYGTKGCGAREGRYGEDCRVCYNDVARAIKNDGDVERAIMCETLEPVEANSGGSHLGYKWPTQERWREERKYGCLS